MQLAGIVVLEPSKARQDSHRAPVALKGPSLVQEHRLVLSVPSTRITLELVIPIVRHVHLASPLPQVPRPVKTARLAFITTLLELGAPLVLVNLRLAKCHQMSS